MNIQAINSVMPAAACQPIKEVGFGKKKTPEVQQSLELVIVDGDIFTPQDPYTTEQKYDMACRLAAYYKMQYDKLLTEKGCLA